MENSQSTPPLAPSAMSTPDLFRHRSRSGVARAGDPSRYGWPRQRFGDRKSRHEGHGEHQGGGR